MISRRRMIVSSLAASLLAATRSASAHGTVTHQDTRVSPPAPDQQAWGIAGDPGKISRTVPIAMSDQMRFTPDRIEVRLGETIRFDYRNSGAVLHEMVIGTRDALAEHAELMKKFPGMEHADAWMAHVAPGERGQMVWTFNRPGTFSFACLIPGHFEAGMIGTIIVAPG